MALLRSFPSIKTGDPQRGRARLVTLRNAAGPAPDPASSPAGDTAVAGSLPGAPAPPSHNTGREAHAAARGGRLAQRWMPAPLRDARWEPGRSGALVLSVVASLAAVVAAAGVWRERPLPEPVPALPLVSTAAAKVTPATGPGREVVVSVVGRVARPGLIHLPDGTRVADALAAAGGALPGTDLVGLNLAQRLSDGEQLLVGVAPPPGQPAGPAVSGAHGNPQIVDLNTATLEQLDGLPGVGTVTAQRILDWRSAHGCFTSVDQLREVSGIGAARLAQLKHRVRV